MFVQSSVIALATQGETLLIRIPSDLFIKLNFAILCALYGDLAGGHRHWGVGRPGQYKPPLVEDRHGGGQLRPVVVVIQ